jgi:hypothetical protein
MKRLLLLLCVAGTYLSLSAQNLPSANKSIAKVHPKAAKIAAKTSKYSYSGDEVYKNLVSKPNPVLSVSSNKTNGTYHEDVIGETYYDLQSNGAVRRHLYLNASDNTLGAAFTYSSQGDPWSDRGTGYNYYDGSSWSADPTQRVESSRTGWGSINLTASGREVVIAHDGSEALYMSYRDAKGTGTWSETEIPTNSGTDVLWPRSAAGGPDGNSIHLFALTYPIANGGSLYQGLDGALLYYRSLDGGDNWDIADSVLSGMDTSSFIGFSADQYAIDANGSTVAFVLFGQLEDTYLMKSTDNGDTWTKTIINDFPLDKYIVDQACGTDTNGDCLPDIVGSSDGVGSVVVDNNGKAHVFFGIMNFKDSADADGSYSWYPWTNGLVYWNDEMGTNQGVAITGALDLNGDSSVFPTNQDIIDAIDNGDDGTIGLYYTSLSSLSSCGVDDSNYIYLSYSALMETLDQGEQNYRHVYAMQLKGSTWSDAVDVTPDDEYMECVFAGMARDVDSHVHWTYQRDSEPGLIVRGDEDQSAVNEIVYLKVPVYSIELGIEDTTLGSSINEENSIVSQMSLYPNPATDYSTLSFTLESNTTLNVEVRDVLGKTVEFITVAKTAAAGSHNLFLNTSGFQSGIYFINLITENNTSSEKLIIQ